MFNFIYSLLVQLSLVSVCSVCAYQRTRQVPKKLLTWFIYVNTNGVFFSFLFSFHFDAVPSSMYAPVRQLWLWMTIIQVKICSLADVHYINIDNFFRYFIGTFSIRLHLESIKNTNIQMYMYRWFDVKWYENTQNWFFFSFDSE